MSWAGESWLMDTQPPSPLQMFWLSMSPVQELGQVMALFVLTVAAAEAAIGLAIMLIYFRNRGSIQVEDVTLMKG